MGKYIITREVERKLSPETSYAIGKYKELSKAQEKAERLENELIQWTSQIPQEEFNSYVEITEEIRKGLLK